MEDEPWQSRVNSSARVPAHGESPISDVAARTSSCLVAVESFGERCIYLLAALASRRNCNLRSARPEISPLTSFPLPVKNPLVMNFVVGDHGAQIVSFPIAGELPQLWRLGNVHIKVDAVTGWRVFHTADFCQNSGLRGLGAGEGKW